MTLPSQWEATLQCNVVSHWLGAFTKWSLKSWEFLYLERWSLYWNRAQVTFPGYGCQFLSYWTYFRKPRKHFSTLRQHRLFKMGIPIPGKDGLYIETGPRLPSQVMVVNPCYIELILGNLENISQHWDSTCCSKWEFQYLEKMVFILKQGPAYLPRWWLSILVILNLF